MARIKPLLMAGISCALLATCSESVEGVGKPSPPSLRTNLFSQRILNFPLSSLIIDAQKPKEVRRSKAYERWTLEPDTIKGLLRQTKEKTQKYLELTEKYLHHFPLEEPDPEDEGVFEAYFKLPDKVRVKPDFGLEGRVIDIVDGEEEFLYREKEEVVYWFVKNERGEVRPPFALFFSVSGTYKTEEEMDENFVRHKTKGLANLYAGMHAFSISEACNDNADGISVEPLKFGFKKDGNAGPVPGVAYTYDKKRLSIRLVAMPKITFYWGLTRESKPKFQPEIKEIQFPRTYRF